MNNLTSFAAIAACMTMSIASCSQTETAPETQTKYNPIEITAKIGGLESKAVPSKDNEVIVNKVQIFVFNEDGSIDGYTSATQYTNNVKVRCTPGKKTIYAIVNGPDEKVESKSELEKKVSWLKDNADRNYIMTGFENSELDAASEVTIPVRRIAARIVLENVIRQFTSPALGDKQLDLTGVYAINVCGDISYDLSSSPTIWYNMQKNENTNDVSHLIYKSLSKQNIKNNTTIPVGAYIYVYPNSTTEDSFSMGGGPRKTRLIVEFVFNGKTCYYPITFDKIEANKTYTINNLTLTRPGGENPDSEITVNDCQFNIRVEDWEVGFSDNIQI